MATRSKSSSANESPTPEVTQPPTTPSIDQAASTPEITKYVPATGLEDYGRWKTMFKDRKANPNEPPFRRGRIWC